MMLRLMGRRSLLLIIMEFWIDGKGWIEADELEVGDALFTDDGDFVEVDGIGVREGSFEVFNFEVEDFNTYFVSEDGVLVHNVNCRTVSDVLNLKVEKNGFEITTQKQNDPNIYVKFSLPKRFNLSLENIIQFSNNKRQDLSDVVHVR